MFNKEYRMFWYILICYEQESVHVICYVFNIECLAALLFTRHVLMIEEMCSIVMKSLMCIKWQVPHVTEEIRCLILEMLLNLVISVVVVQLGFHR